jgi:hypothetical protein
MVFYGSWVGPCRCSKQKQYFAVVSNIGRGFLSIGAALEIRGRRNPRSLWVVRVAAYDLKTEGTGNP